MTQYARLYAIVTAWTLCSAQHCLYPLHKNVRLPGPDKRTFRECDPSGNFTLKDCPGDSEYDIQLQACKFVDPDPTDQASINLNSIMQERLGKAPGAYQAQGGGSMGAGGPIVQYAPSLPNQGPMIKHQGQWLPVTSSGIVEQPIELLQNCALDAWCPHDPKKLQYCDLNGQQFLQCSASGWVLKSCPFGTHFVGPIGRCVDPREAGAGGSVLVPPTPVAPPAGAPSSNIPFAPPGLQAPGGPSAPPAPPPAAGTWIGSSLPVAAQPQPQPQLQQQPVVQAAPPQPPVNIQSPLHTPVVAPLPIQPQPRPVFPPSSPTAQLFTQGSSPSGGPLPPSDTLLQKANELPQGQLVVIGANAPAPAGFPPGPQSGSLNPAGVPEGPHTFGVPSSPQFPVPHPRNKVFPPPSWTSSGEQLGSSSGELGPGAPGAPLDLPPRWNPAPVVATVDGSGGPSAGTSVLLAPNSQLANVQQLEGNRGPVVNRAPSPSQNWVLGGNVNNLSPNTDIRELPLGTWVPAFPQQGADTVISRRYSGGAVDAASGPSDLSSDRSEPQDDDEKANKKKA